MAEAPASPEQRTLFSWEQLPELPDKFGFGGPLVGTHNGVLIVAGGANFSNGPPWTVGDKPAGSKVWHDRIFVLLPGEKYWRDAGRLPRPLAYAAVVSLASGMYVLGGESFDEKQNNHDTAGVLRLTWNDAKKQAEVEDNALPPLPRASSYHGAGTIGNTIYVAASHTQGDDSRRLDTKALWAINVSASKNNRSWQSLPVWPGSPRYKMAVATAEVADGNNDPHEQLFLFSGGTWVKNDSGEFDLAKFEYYDDAYRFDPATEKWTQLASLPKFEETRQVNTASYRFDESANAWIPLAENEKQPATDIHTLFDATPRAAVAALAMNDGNDRILLFSGSTGRYVTMAVQDRPPFPGEVLSYDVAANRWSVAGRMSHAVVTSGAVWWQDRIVIASGEVRPGVRTRKVQSREVRENRP